MAEASDKCDLKILLASENTSEIKVELEDDNCADDKVYIYQTTNKSAETKCVQEDIKNECEISTLDSAETELSLSQVNTVINDDFKIKDEIYAVDNMKIECNNELLFYNHCHEYYQDYCTKCGMLLHILNKNTHINAYNRVIEEIPNNILEVRRSFGHLGIFALKVIPEGVRFGPFAGLDASSTSYRIKGGRFVVAEEKYLNWMRYINPARNAFEQNLHAFQDDNSIYYLSSREIQVCEELLVYFGEEYEDSLNENVEIDFIPRIEHGNKDVFACAFCCLGFSSRVYLAQHKNICVYENPRQFLIQDLTQCPHCRIYLGTKEYLEFHMPYCGERVRLDSKVVDMEEQKGRERLSNRAIRHREMQTHRRVELLNEHADDPHIKSGEGKETGKRPASASLKADAEARDSEAKQFECSACQFRTKYKYALKRHTNSRHLRNDSFECTACAYKTHTKQYLECHKRTKHLKEFNYECETCDYKTNVKSNLEVHVKTKHLKEFDYKCETCDFQTSQKLNLERHVKTKHLKDFDYECETCGFRTNNRSILEGHTKTKHLKVFKHKCETCEYETNNAANLENHTKIKHLKEYDYACEACEYKTNYKGDFEIHTNTKHLKEFKYRCETCEYATNWKSHLTMHTKTKHLREFGVACEICEFKTNFKTHLKIHVKTKHLKEFDYKCRSCEFKTNVKSNLDMHTKTKHFRFKIADDDVGTS